MTADQDGRSPVFRIPLNGDAPEQLTTDDFSYTDVAVDPATGDILALRSSWIAPAHPVRIGRSGRITPLATPAPLPAVPGQLTEIETTVADGSRVRAWLLLPESASTPFTDLMSITDNSPQHSVANIVTPMLVIHGDHDYRVPIGESLRLWSELAEHHAGPGGMTKHKFLYFPDENHWVLKLQHAVVWYQTVFAFLDQHVHGAAWQRPELLG